MVPLSPPSTTPSTADRPGAWPFGLTGSMASPGVRDGLGARRGQATAFSPFGTLSDLLIALPNPDPHLARGPPLGPGLHGSSD